MQNTPVQKLILLLIYINSLNHNPSENLLKQKMLSVLYQYH